MPIKPWTCKVCEDGIWRNTGEMARHIFINHVQEIIKEIPIYCFTAIGNLFLTDFLDLWKLVVRKKGYKKEYTKNTD